VNQKQFDVRWRPGKTNLADYPTKHHTGQHHQQVRPIYLYEPNNSPETVQGCIKILAGGHKAKALRAQHARPQERRVTWDPNMPTYKGQRCKQRCTPKRSPSTENIHSPNNYNLVHVHKTNNYMMKKMPKLPKRLSSLY
jgi:hypothetical protein